MKFLLIEIICIFYLLIQLSEQTSSTSSSSTEYDSETDEEEDEEKDKKKDEEKDKKKDEESDEEDDEGEYEEVEQNYDDFPIPKCNCTRKILIFEDENQLSAALCEKLEKLANETIPSSKFFKIGITNDAIKPLAKGLSKIKTEWSKWRFFFCDERIVPFNNPHSNYGALKAAFPKIKGLEDDQFIAANTTAGLTYAQDDYFEKMLDYFLMLHTPRFHVLLLNLGEDGSTCSLFPNRIDRIAVEWVQIETYSPEPPHRRLTLTLPVINNAQNVIFLVTGESKAETVKIILEKLPAGKSMPAALVNLLKGEITWMLDKKAASKLSEHTLSEFS